MATSMMELIEESLDPRAISNAIYEMMVDWRGCVMMSHSATNKSNRKQWNRKRAWLETTLGRFFNRGDLEMRALLEKHFGIKVVGDRG